MILKIFLFLFYPFVPLVFLITRQLERKTPFLAQAIYLSIQNFYPDRSNSNYSLGHFLLDQHKPEEALRYLSIAQQIKPKAVNIKYDLASAYWDAGDLNPAIELSESFLDNTRVKHPVLLRSLAKLYLHKGDFEAASHVLNKAIVANKNYAVAYYDLALLQQSVGQQSKQAQEYLTKALIIDNDFTDAHIELAKLLFNDKLFAEAIPHFIKAIKANMTDLSLFSGLIRSFIRTKQYDEGLAYCDQGQKFHPQHPYLLFFYGECYRGINAHQQSITALKLAISGMADFADGHASLAYSYRNAGQFNEALEAINKAIEINSQRAEYFNVKGLIQQELIELKEAISSFNQAYELDAEFYVVLWHRALIKLLLFDFKTAWQDYGYRFKAGAQEKRDFPFPEWQGKSLKGKRLLIYAEQGLGDELMFASCIPDIINQADHCIIDCCAKLETLFQRSFPKASVKISDQNEKCDWINGVEADMQISIADLPLYFRTCWEQFPGSAYLFASQEKSHRWRKKLEALDGKFNLGISWIGGVQKTRRHWRSFALQTLLPILNLQDINFVSLQYTDCEDEIASFEDNNGIKVHHWQQAIDDYDETAALVQSLDLVISVQTAIIHLAGALGKPAWVMVRNNPEWRYGASGQKMPWYRSIKLFRQKQFGDWPEVVDRVAESLQQLLKEKSSL